MFRSLLFVPADSERKIARALGGDADALILDLEDAVAPDRKVGAREACAAFLAGHDGSKPVFVRINGFDTGHALADLAAIVRVRPAGIVLPKCRDAADLARLGDLLSILEVRDGIAPGSLATIPIATETALSLSGLATYARDPHPRLYGLLWGGEDLAADLGARGNRDQEGRYAPVYELARSQCLVAARAAGVEPIDAVFTDFRDAAGLERESRAAAFSGFTGKAAIHPDQVPIINAAFTPSPADVAEAKRVLAAFAASPEAGAVNLGGRMLDGPHRKAAERLLKRAPDAPAV